MNQLSGTVYASKSVEEITHVHIEVGSKILSSLVLSSNETYSLGQKVHLFFKETEVMIATSASKVSARNAFVSPITHIHEGLLLAEVHFDFDGVKIVCVVTKEALHDLQCRVGDSFQWFVKSNEVSIQALSEV